jgi:hypothetical protein
MKTTNVSVSDFFELYAGEKMVSGGDIGEVVGYTKSFIVLGLKNEAGVSFDIIPFQKKGLFASFHDSYCFANPDSSLLLENWVREQHRDNFRHGVTLVVAAFILLILSL